MTRSPQQVLYGFMAHRRQGVVAIILNIILVPLTWVYRLGLLFRGMLYDHGVIRPYRSPKKVICVGNIAMGGTGKTPVILYLIKYFQKKMFSMAVISRGYMAEEGAQSDEVAMMKEIVPWLPVYVGSDRVMSMKEASAEHAVEVFLMDDAFQHWRVERDLDIVVIDAVNPFGNEFVLPRGILREPIASLARADIVILTRCAEGQSNIPRLRRICDKLNPQVAVIEAEHQPVSLTALFSGEKTLDLALLNDDVCGVCAIGNPERFRSSLTACGARVRQFVEFIDHHVYTEQDVRGIVALCRKNEIRKVITTHKDAVKLRKYPEMFSGIDVFVLNIEIRITHGENEFLSRIDRLFRS